MVERENIKHIKPTSSVKQPPRSDICVVLLEQNTYANRHIHSEPVARCSILRKKFETDMWVYLNISTEFKPKISAMEDGKLLSALLNCMFYPNFQEKGYGRKTTGK